MSVSCKWVGVSTSQQEASERPYGEAINSLRISSSRTPSEGRWIPAMEEPTIKC